MKNHSRRRFLTRSVQAVATLGLSGNLLQWMGCQSKSALKKEWYADQFRAMTFREGKVFRADANLASVILSRCGETMNDGLSVPDRHDGMACFSIGPNQWALIRNHELDTSLTTRSPVPEKAYDPHSQGGTTTLFVDTSSGHVQLKKHFLSLTGTSRNCAGGPTPWGTWITCEEDPSVPLKTQDGEYLNPAVTKFHGFAFEVGLGDGLKKAEPLPMGRFNREAIAVGPDGSVYQTEDRSDAVLTMFKPKVPRQLHRGGELWALAVKDRPKFETSNSENIVLKKGERLPLEWIPLKLNLSGRDDLRTQAQSKGAAIFNRTEGIFAFRDGIYFAATSGGHARAGQIFRLDPKAQTLELFLESTSDEVLSYPDNIAFSPSGNLYICEDSSHENRLIQVSPTGQMRCLASTESGEWAGVTVSSDGRFLFVNLQRKESFTVAFSGIDF